MIYQILFISDLHFGNQKLKGKDLYNELKENFLNYYEDIVLENNSLEEPLRLMVILGGDIFDNKINYNDDDAKYVLKFIDDIVEISQLNKHKFLPIIRVIQGTLSHDLMQLSTFTYLEQRENLNFRVITTAQEEIIDDDFNVLYLPEEYMEDQTSYYKDLFNKKYSAIFGHGTFDFTEFPNSTIESEKPLKNAPVYNSILLSNLSKTFIFFGHIHIADEKDNIYYAGSFSRWHYGEEAPKGFLVGILDSEDNEYEVHRIENDLAPSYPTVKLSDYFDSETIDIEELTNIIKQIKQDKKNVRIINDTVLNLAESKMIQENFKFDDDIKIVNKHKQVLEDEDRDPTFDFILKKEFSVSETIKRFVKIKRNLDLDINLIEEAITQDV